MSIWIHRRDPDAVAAERDAALTRGEPSDERPLAGLTVAVKDNIDVVGMPTTAGCPAYAYEPERDATCVARLRAAGAIIVGKTNLDQFATGLVGTRSPYGAVASIHDPARVGGGSSSGSAAAVALGEVDLALGTDTAGSGRVPAAFQRIVGAKPTYGRVPVDGVVPACRSFDCVSVFAQDVSLAEAVLEVIGETVAGRLAAGPEPRVALFDGVALPGPELPFELGTIDPEPFLEAGALLYGGAFLTERYAAVGRFIETHRDACDPTVAELILARAGATAAEYLDDVVTLAALRQRALALLDGYDALVVPTAPYQPTLAEVAADPIGANARVGTYTTFANLIGLCAYALPNGLSVLARAGDDRLCGDLARRIGGADPAGGPTRPPAGSTALLVVGAHLRGMPLNHELVALGARFLESVATAPAYRLYALETEPPKPGLVRGGSGSVPGELWALTPAALGAFLAGLPEPMGLGPVTLTDGRTVVGFMCETAALEGARDITGFGGWRAYQGAQTTIGPAVGVNPPGGRTAPGGTCTV